LIKDYDLIIQYHLVKANVVADALSGIGVPKVAMFFITDLDRMGVSLCYAVTAREDTQCLFSHLFLRGFEGTTTGSLDSGCSKEDS
jgi:hypothetical protein